MRKWCRTVTCRARALALTSLLLAVLAVGLPLLADLTRDSLGARATRTETALSGALTAEQQTLSKQKPLFEQQPVPAQQSARETSNQRAPGWFTAIVARGLDALFMAEAAAAKKAKPSAADINRALKLYKSRKYANALTLLNGAIDSGSLKSSDMARALHYRGKTLRKQGKYAQAIADFTNALWLKNGLGATMRKEAEQERAAAYKAAGLQNPTGGAARARSSARVASRATSAKGAPRQGWQSQTRARAPVPARPAAPAKQTAKKSSGGIGGFFSNLFSGAKKKSAPATAQAPAPAAGAPETGAITQVSGWSSRTDVQARPPAAKVRSRAANAPRRAAATRRPARAKHRKTAVKVASRGGARKAAASRTKRNAVYRLILSPVRSQTVAQANARKMKQLFASATAQRKPVIESTTFGGSTFYQVRVGPFDNAKTPQAMCSKLKASGVDCILATQSR